MHAESHKSWPLAAAELKPALTLALELEHAAMGVLMLRDEASGSLQPVFAEGLTDDQWPRFGAHLPGVGPVGVACAEHRRVTVQDAFGDPQVDGLREVASLLGFRAMDIVPLEHDGIIIGAVAVLFTRIHRPSARSGRLVELCGRVVGYAFENARLRMHADRRRVHAEELANARVQFLARMSHELRTPLQSITGYIDLLRLGAPDTLTPRQAELLDRVSNSEQILIAVIDDLITFARLEAGRVSYKIGTVLAYDAMHVSQLIIAPLAERRGLHLVVDPPPDHLVVKADPTKVKQILVNLLANAVKFTPPRGTVRLTPRMTDGTVCFDVTDTGPGISPEKLSDVFQPYVQLPDPVFGSLAGSGLGLAISREFAAGMGGGLTATSSPGKGSVFTLCLPRDHEIVPASDVSAAT